MPEIKTFAQSGAQAFHTTRWTMVMRARGDAPEARVALGDLCEAYWTPVYRFLRREGRDEDESEELAQEFFSRLLSGQAIDKADPGKGRFRSYILGALKHFLSDRRRAEGRQKRGGDAIIESIESRDGETSPEMQLPDAGATPTDAWFDRHWALAVMERGLITVEKSFGETAKKRQFEVLKPWLVGDVQGLSQADAAAELQMSPGAIKVAIHRLRQKFGDAIRREIAETVDTEEEIAEELRYLIEALQAD
ncbi:RNA polymerase sigma factor [Haloferula sp. A504]|uniref:RNA polymerase sigma factor n=1 Tax=Haloferula sp. A504 TaxID=3373601 RepID=UPI0031BC68FC|nr:sigma-70 family RNA polymerase sigma factor [Verrucomicrobiaceae bacterium E54]